MYGFDPSVPQWPRVQLDSMSSAWDWAAGLVSRVTSFRPASERLVD